MGIGLPMATGLQANLAGSALLLLVLIGKNPGWSAKKMWQVTFKNCCA